MQAGDTDELSISSKLLPEKMAAWPEATSDERKPVRSVVDHWQSNLKLITKRYRGWQHLAPCMGGKACFAGEGLGGNCCSISFSGSFLVGQSHRL